ncbi:MAG: hypothetical protein ACTSW1_19725 [Candidatus Hodarchaeales archaeon]
MSEEKTKGTYRFDLSDGFGKDDIFAILGGLWFLIIGFLKIIFWPYVWIFREFGRSIRFIQVKEASTKSLNEDERVFMESIPTFFVAIGLFLGIFIGFFYAIFGSDAIESFVESISLDYIIGGIGWLLNFILEVILWIIGLDTGTGADKVYRFGIVDIVRTIFEIIVGVFTQDPVLLFLGIGIVGIIIAVIWIVISETGVVSAFIATVKMIFRFLRTAPKKVFNRLNNIFIVFNSRLASFVIGTERLENRTVSFHRKILLYSLGLGVWSLLGGLVTLASQGGFKETALQVSFILVVLTFFGFGVGIVEMFLITRFLDIVSRGKYTINQSD